MSMRRLHQGKLSTLPVQVLVPGPLRESPKGKVARQAAEVVTDSDWDQDDDDDGDSEMDEDDEDDWDSQFGVECEDDGEGHCVRCGRPLR